MSSSEVRFRPSGETGAAIGCVAPPREGLHREGLPRSRVAGRLRTPDHFVVAIGSSMGGIRALESILTAMPGNAPGLIIVQHMHADFTRGFARQLGSLSTMEVSEAADGDAVVPGRALIAPGDRHVVLHSKGARYFLQVCDGPFFRGHRPSVDVLFESVAACAGAHAVGVILTGMGKDGAAGLGQMQRAGARTIAQDKASSLVWGMPGEAVARGAVDRTVDLSEIPREILTAASGPAAVRDAVAPPAQREDRRMFRPWTVAGARSVA